MMVHRPRCSESTKRLPLDVTASMGGAMSPTLSMRSSSKFFPRRSPYPLFGVLAIRRRRDVLFPRGEGVGETLREPGKEADPQHVREIVRPARVPPRREALGVLLDPGGG